jgi:hypothetical protein
MREPGNRLGFALELFCLAAGQVRMQYLDGCLQRQPYVLAQVDLGIATLSQQADQPVVAKLLSHPIGHNLGLLGVDYRTRKATCHPIVGSAATPVKVILLTEADYDTIIRNKSKSLAVLLTD